MDLLLVIIGLFLLTAILRNKDLSVNKDNSEVFSFLSFSVIILVLSGFGFLFPASTHIATSHSFLFIFLASCAAITAYSKGPAKVISRIAWVSILAFIIMGSFM